MTYEIENPDFMECDATFVAKGRRVYFQFDGWEFARQKRMPDIDDVIRFLETDTFDDYTDDLAFVRSIKASLSEAPPAVKPLHPDTDKLVDDFAAALREKLHRAQEKYGHTNEWLTEDWELRCQSELLEHVAKGDPIDVAAYAAFCWARKWPSSPQKSLED